VVVAGAEDGRQDRLRTLVGVRAHGSGEAPAPKKSSASLARSRMPSVQSTSTSPGSNRARPRWMTPLHQRRTPSPRMRGKLRVSRVVTS
jgi:hypothetical protein